MSVIEIAGNLPFDVTDMIPVSPIEMFVNVNKVISDCSVINPGNINWGEVDRNTWFICIDLKTKKSYCFPICEGENRDNNYERAKAGISHFNQMGYSLYNISS